MFRLYRCGGVVGIERANVDPNNHKFISVVDEGEYYGLDRDESRLYWALPGGVGGSALGDEMGELFTYDEEG